MGDELHAVAAMQEYSYSHIFSHFFPADICTPLALVYKGMADTIGLNELNMRLPSLLFGIALLIAFPLLLRRDIDDMGVLFLSALIAISPFLIYYSRFARPYAIMAFCGPIACIAQYRFVENGKMRWGVLYILVSSTSIYMHILSAAFVVSPLFVAFIMQIIRARRRQENYVAGIMWQSLIIFVIVFILHVPPFINSYQNLLGKAGTDHVKWETLMGGVQLISGTNESTLATTFFVLIAIGCFLLFKKNRDLAIFLTIPCILQFATAISSGASLIGMPGVLIRYCIQVLPIFLLFAAITISTVILFAFKRGHCLGFMATSFFVVYIALLYTYGPIPHFYQYPNNFTNYAQAQGNYNDPFFQKEIPYPVSKFYHMLNEMDGEFSVIEAPWYFQFYNTRFHTYQKIHKKEIFIGLVSAYTRRYTFEIALRNKEQYTFKRFISLDDPETIKGSGARFLIVHNDLSKEVNETQTRPIDSVPVIHAMKERYGAPFFVDKVLTVFDLASQEDRAMDSTGSRLSIQP